MVNPTVLVVLSHYRKNKSNGGFMLFHKNQLFSSSTTLCLAKCFCVLLCFLWGFGSVYVSAAEQELTLDKAIKVAQKNDLWLKANQYQQHAMESMSTFASTLPDPKVSIGLANMPTDGFSFIQEGMTQVKVGIAQMFPRGDSLTINQQQLKTQSEAYPFQRQDRQAKVAVTVGSLWLEAFKAQQSIALIEHDRGLFEQLADIVQANYSSAVGKTRQQDIVRAQLELTRLDDRLDVLLQQKSRYEGQLLQWLSDLFVERETEVLSETQSNGNEFSTKKFTLSPLIFSQTLPDIQLINTELVTRQTGVTAEQLANVFSQHPAIKAVDKKVSASKSGIQLAQQKYKPEWGVNASYGYRDDDPMGNSRADFLSVGVTFDVPLFTDNRQDNEVKAAISSAEAMKTERLLLLRQFISDFYSAKGRLVKITDRQSLYQEKLLPQTQEQAEASLSAYTHDDGDFAEVVRSRIAVLNAKLDALSIEVEKQKIHLEINYLFIQEFALNNNSNTRSISENHHGN